MSRIQAVDPQSATGDAQALLQAVQKKMGMVPNMLKSMAVAPAALKAYLDFSGAVATSSLSPRLREQLALTVGELNACGYCLSAHTAIGGQLGLDAAQLEAARRGEAEDPRDAAALALARTLVLERGDLRDEDLRAARDAGLDDQQIVEVLAVVVLNTFTNWFNHVARAAIDFPEVKPGVGVRA
jgi:uncharacterized peroxidase-related enzyme